MNMTLAIIPGLLFVTLFASWSSPVFKYAYGCDSAFYSMVGRSVLEGKIPYRDYFDIKGPVFFFWQAFGQLLHKDRMGVFLLELISAAGTAYFLYKICEMYQLSKRQIVLTYCIFYFTFAAWLWGGNTAEELWLPLNMACIYQGLRFLRRDTEQVWAAYLYGITLAICLLSKATVAAPAFSLIPVIVIFLIARKEYKALICSISLLSAGMISICVPVYLFFAINGAVEEFIFCVFKLAGNRAVDYYVSFNLDWELQILPCYVALIYFLVNIRKKGIEKYVILSMAVITTAVLHLGSAYDYYFIAEVPLIALLSVNILKIYNEMLANKKNRKVFNSLFGIFNVGILCILLILIKCTAPVYDRVRLNLNLVNNQREINSYQEAVEVFEHVPEEERDEIYSLESDMIFFEINQVLPTQKYCNNLFYFCSMHPQIEEEVLHFLDEEQPAWIVTKRIDFLAKGKILEKVFEDYELEFKNDMQELWKRKSVENVKNIPDVIETAMNKGEQSFFGEKEGKKWYIAEERRDGSVVLMCDLNHPMITDKQFYSSSSAVILTK